MGLRICCIHTEWQFGLTFLSGAHSQSRMIAGHADPNLMTLWEMKHDCGWKRPTRHRAAKSPQCTQALGRKNSSLISLNTCRIQASHYGTRKNKATSCRSLTSHCALMEWNELRGRENVLIMGIAFRPHSFPWSQRSTAVPVNIQRCSET